jgi:hypothetical protein
MREEISRHWRADKFKEFLDVNLEKRGNLEVKHWLKLLFQNKFSCLIVWRDISLVLSCLKHSEILKLSRVLSHAHGFNVTEDSTTISVSIIRILCKIDKSSREIKCLSDPDDWNRNIR